VTEPTQTCRLCGNAEIVTPDGRGYPPDIAERKLVKRCKSQGCRCDPYYQAGIDASLLRRLQGPR
jgi:hypothetical protein